MSGFPVAKQLNILLGTETPDIPRTSVIIAISHAFNDIKMVLLAVG
jgi:hypothetical protein